MMQKFSSNFLLVARQVDVARVFKKAVAESWPRDYETRRQKFEKHCAARLGVGESYCAIGWVGHSSESCIFPGYEYIRYSISGEYLIVIKELDSVVLTTDLPEHGLARDDIGTVVLVHEGGKGCTVEFMTLAGRTIAVVTLLASQIRQIAKDEIAHARHVDAVA
jgi:predicted metal-binding transcription factor (methanogenesis marker protein 9)